MQTRRFGCFELGRFVGTCICTVLVIFNLAGCTQHPYAVERYELPSKPWDFITQSYLETGGDESRMAKQARDRAEAMNFDLKIVKQDYEAANATCTFQGDNNLHCEAYRKWRWIKPRLTQPLVGPELIEKSGYNERTISYLIIDGDP